MGAGRSCKTATLLLVWHLLLVCLVLPGRCQVLGDVFLYEAGRGEHDPVHFDPFPDLPADFGPEIPDEGVDGLLLVADPEDACQPLKFRYDDEPWVALISRSQHLHPTNCTFDVKVHNAELAGASAAIVYDDVYEALIIMSKPRDHPEPGIPAVFVSEKAGIIMRKLMTPGVTRVRIVPVSASAWMSLLMSAFLGFLALTVVLATFYVMRSWSMWLGRTRRRGMAPELAGFGAAGAQGAGQEGLPACAIRALPILIYEGKAGKRRSSSSSSAGGGGANSNNSRATPQGAPAAATAATAASAPVPILGPGAVSGGNAAWVLSSPSMPATPQGAPAAGAGAGTAPGNAQQQQRQQQSMGPRLHNQAADAAVVLIESDSESDAGNRAAAQQQPGGLGRRLASSSSNAVTSGLVSLASLAAAGSRRVLLMAGQSPPSSPSNDLTGALAAAAAGAAAGGTATGAAGWCQPAPAGQPTQAVDVPRAQQSTTAAAAAHAEHSEFGPDLPGADPSSPAGSGSCRSSVLSTDEEDAGVPEVVQSWPGAGGMAHVVTGGPVGARGGATRHTCVVCLERYTAGDKVRVLPCQHRFHAKCIDPWLASRRLCPVCKHDASTWPSNSMQALLAGAVPLDTPAPAATAAAAGAGDAGRQSGGGVSLLSASSLTGSVSLGRSVWFRRLRARLASASRRRQQQQQQQLLSGGSGGGGGASVSATAAAAAAAEAVAAEAGLLQVPPAAVTVDLRQGQQQQQPVRAVHGQAGGDSLREPLLGPEAGVQQQRQ